MYSKIIIVTLCVVIMERDSKGQADSWSRIGLDIDPHEDNSLFPDKGASQVRCKKQVSM